MGEAFVNGFVEGRDLVLLSRAESGQLVERRIPAQWAAYFRAGELPPALRRQLEGARSVASVKAEGEWLRVTFRDEDARRWICSDRDRRDKETGRTYVSPLVKHGVQHYEADLSAVARYFTDTGHAIQRPRRAYLDIETDSRLSFSRKEEMRVLCWAVTNDQRETTCGVLDGWGDAEERACLEEMWEALRPYDQVASWNGDGFDFPVIYARSDHTRVRKVDSRKWLWVDHMLAFKKMNMHAAESGEEKRSMRLQSIAMAILGRGKKEFDASKTYEAWSQGGEARRKLVAYCAEDAALMPDIEKKTGYLDLFQTICEVCRIFGHTSALNPTRQMDGFLLRLANERGHHFPSRVFHEGAEDQPKEQFKGAFVMQPKSLNADWRKRVGMEDGILRGVHVADFASMYPSIILTWNMSADTKALIPINGPVPEGFARCPKTGTGFSTGRRGILPEAIAELLRMRQHWNDVKASLPPGTPEWHASNRLSNAYKVCANSFFGVTGNKYSRFHDRAIAEGITQNGAWLIERTIAAAEERGWEVSYGDTDSIFVSGPSNEEFKAFCQWCNEDYYPELLRAAGCTQNHIKVAYEKKFRTLVFTAAKRYIGVYEHYKGKAATKDSRPEIRGLEYKRGDCTILGARLQKDAVDLLVTGTVSPDAFHDLLSRARTHVLEDALPLEEIMQSKSLSRKLKEYVTKKKTDGTDGAQPAHVVVAHMLAKRGRDVSEGSRVEYVVVDAVADDPQKRVLPAEDYQGECDRHYVWETLVYPPTERLLAAAFPGSLKHWEAWARSRPPRPRRGREVLEGQTALFESGETRVSPAPALPAPSRPSTA